MKRQLAFAKVIWILWEGKMIIQAKAKNPTARNFVIVCDYGDWSGFRTLVECEDQFPELERAGRKNGYYWVEER